LSTKQLETKLSDMLHVQAYQKVVFVHFIVWFNCCQSLYSIYL
jgi:hypothetical protein